MGLVALARGWPSRVRRSVPPRRRLGGATTSRPTSAAPKSAPCRVQPPSRAAAGAAADRRLDDRNSVRVDPPHDREGPRGDLVRTGPSPHRGERLGADNAAGHGGQPGQTDTTAREALAARVGSARLVELQRLRRVHGRRAIRAAPTTGTDVQVTYPSALKVHTGLNHALAGGDRVSFVDRSVTLPIKRGNPDAMVTMRSLFRARAHPHRVRGDHSQTTRSCPST